MTYIPTPLSLFIGVRVGFHTIEEVVAWADLEIERVESPSDQLIALAMANTKQGDDAFRLLRELSGDVSAREEAELRFAFVYRMLVDGSINLDQATRRPASITHDDGVTELRRTNATSSTTSTMATNWR